MSQITVPHAKVHPTRSRLIRDKRLSLLIALPVIALAAAIGIYVVNNSHAAKPGIIYRQGMNLYLNGQPYKFMGVNSAATVSGSCGLTASDAAMDALLKSMPPRSMLRIWMLRSSGNISRLDTLMDKAEQNGQFLTIALADVGGNCDTTTKVSGFFSGGYKGDYHNWVRQIVGRYKDRTGVGIWEMANEAGDNVDNFYNDTSALIKSIDPNHLVSTGTNSYDNSNGHVRFKASHASPNIDLVSEHEYDNGPGESYWANVCREVAASLGKPCYVGEFGYMASQNGDPNQKLMNFKCETYATRDNWIKQKATTYMARNEIAGTMVWNYAHRDTSMCGIDFNASSSVMSVIRSVTGYPNGSGNATTSPNTPTPTPTATPTPSPTAIPIPATSGSVNDTNFVYTGNWMTSNGSGVFQGNDHYSLTAGDSYSLSFTGTGANVYMSKAPHHGIAGVSVDGGAEKTVDLYSADRLDQQLVFNTGTLASGTHAIKVRVTGSKNAASTGTVVTADRIDITGGGAATPAPSTAPLTKPGDVNGDGKVNISDLSILLSKWGQNYAAADFNKDGTINISDLSVLLSKWTG